jgi:hypothetical protein
MGRSFETIWVHKRFSKSSCGLKVNPKKNSSNDDFDSDWQQQ